MSITDDPLDKPTRRRAKRKATNFNRSRVTVVDLGDELTERVRAVAKENKMTVAMATRFLIRKAFIDAKTSPEMIVRIPEETFLS